MVFVAVEKPAGTAGGGISEIQQMFVFFSSHLLGDTGIEV